MTENNDRQKYLIAMVLEDLSQALSSNKNDNKVHIVAPTPNAYYWAYFDDDEEQWYHPVDGYDIREAPFFANRIADDKKDVLELLQSRGVVNSFTVNTFKRDPEGMGWKDYKEIDSFDVNVNMPKFAKYYERYIKATELSATSNSRKDAYSREIGILKIDGTQIFIGYENSSMFLQKSVRLDSPLYFLFHYLQTHTNTDVTLATIHTLDMCGSVSDLTEKVREIGFNKGMKKLFFPTLSSTRIRFVPRVELSHKQNATFEKHLLSLKKIENIS